MRMRRGAPPGSWSPCDEREELGVLVAREDATLQLAQALAWRGRVARSAETFLVERKAGVVRALSSRAPQLGFRAVAALAPGVGDLLVSLSAGNAAAGSAGSGGAASRIAAFAPRAGASVGGGDHTPLVRMPSRGSRRPWSPRSPRPRSASSPPCSGASRSGSGAAP